jgi:hypothetical protein
MCDTRELTALRMDGRTSNEYNPIGHINPAGLASRISLAQIRVLKPFGATVLVRC